jgi:hypothetical protein
MTEKKKPITERQELFLEALLGEANGNLRAAMTIAGYSPRTTINEAIAPIKNEVIERASTALAINSPKAVLSMIGVLSDPTSLGAKNAIAAAAQVLDRAGLVKKEQVEVKNTGQAMFILPPKDSGENDLGE